MERLQRANEFKSEVLGTVAHDLKNPLGVILGRTEMLERACSPQNRAGRQRCASRSSTSASPPAG